MEWFYAHGNDQKGPVYAAELIELRKSGQVTDDTLVWRDGMGDWIPLREADISAPGQGEAAATASESGEELVVCAYSGKSLAKSRMVAYGDKFVAPEHKDAFVQRLREGVTVNDPSELVPDDYTVDIGHCVSRAWQLMKLDFWPIVGISFLIFIAYSAATNIPFVGALAAMLLAVPIFAGLFYYYLRKIRGQLSTIEHAFSGFTRNFGQLVLLNLVMSLIVFAAMIPGLVFLVIGIAGAEGAGASSDVVVGVLVGVGVVLILIPAVYLQVAWTFSWILCIDRMIPFWPAMKVSMRTVNKHWFQCIWFTFVIGCVSMLGFVALCVGFLVTWPLATIALAYLYEDIYSHSSKDEYPSYQT